MKRFFIFCVAISLAVAISAQELLIESFREDSKDKYEPYRPVFDLNGDETAVLYLFTNNLQNLEFKGNIVGNVEKSPSYYKLFLLSGTRSLTIYSDGYLPTSIDITKYNFCKPGVKGGSCYSLSIKGLENANISNYGPGSKILSFKSNKPLGELLVNNEKWPVEDYYSEKLVPFGSYKYEARSSSGEILTGTVEVTNSFGKLKINLNF